MQPVGIAQIQHGGHVPGVAVLKGKHPVGGAALFHPVEHVGPGGAGHGLGLGEQPCQGDVGKGALHPLVGHRVPAQGVGLVLAGNRHGGLLELRIIGAQGRVLNTGGVLFDHLFFPGGVQHRDVVFLLVGGHPGHLGHPLFKQGGHLRVNLVDGMAGALQFLHDKTSLTPPQKAARLLPFFHSL